VKPFTVTVAGVTVKAGDVGEALEVTADLLEAAGADASVTVCFDDELDETLTELAREGLRPVRLGYGRNVHLGVGAPAA
jgi:hypothetical protein